MVTIIVLATVAVLGMAALIVQSYLFAKSARGEAERTADLARTAFVYMKSGSATEAAQVEATQEYVAEEAASEPPKHFVEAFMPGAGIVNLRQTTTQDGTLILETPDGRKLESLI